MSRFDAALTAMLAEASQHHAALSAITDGQHAWPSAAAVLAESVRFAGEVRGGGGGGGGGAGAIAWARLRMATRACSSIVWLVWCGRQRWRRMTTGSPYGPRCHCSAPAQCQ